MSGVVLAAALALASATATPSRDLSGPLSDFWPRVKLDWSRRLEGLNRGPGQTFIWVAMIWDGPDDLGLEGLVDELQQREAGRWVRSQITKHRWSTIADRDPEGKQALRQSLILLGTPEDNGLVRRALERLPLRIGPGRVSTGLTDFEGDDLLVVAIAPSPVEPERYALVITGTSPVPLLDVVDIPYGPTDYVIFRGKKVLERGFFRWSGGSPRTDHVHRPESFTQHFRWSSLDSGRFRLHYDPATLTREEVASAGREMDADMEVTASFFGIDRDPIERIDCYLYSSLDEKVWQTGDTRPAHIGRLSREIHAVHGGGASAIDPSLGARVLLARGSQRWGGGGERELPGLAFALGLAARDRFQGVSLEEWAARSSRDTGYVPMDLLLSRQPKDLESGDLSALDAAAFVRHLILEKGPDQVARFYRTARRAGFHDMFRTIFGESIRKAELAWLDSLPERPARGELESGRDTSGTEAAAPPDPGLVEAMEALRSRDDAKAGRLLEALPPSAASLAALARIQFRNGLFDRAAGTAARALELPGGGPQERAWARLTLARSAAMKGLMIAALAELRHDDIRNGPDQVRIIADYWIEKLGRPLNQKEAHRVLMAEAETDLMNFKWEEAESKLRSLLAADPLNREAHAALGNVYMSKYQYWYDWILLDRELFPGISEADPLTYKYLADKGEKELRLAESLPSSISEDWLTSMPAIQPGTEEAAPHYLQGRLHFLKGDLPAARGEMETALSLEAVDSPLAAYCRLYLGRIAALEGDFEAARSHLESVVRMRISAKLTTLAEEALRTLEDASAENPR